MPYDEIKKLPRRKASGVHSVIFVPLSYKDLSEGVLILRSVKEKHFSQKEKSILELFGSFASLAIKKNELYDETKAALEVRDMFISLASHELRTPLTSINGYIQLLHSRMGKDDTSEAKWIRELYEESKRMTNLVQELLEINRIKQGQLQFVLREAQFSEIMQNAIRECQATSPERNIIFENKLDERSSMVVGDSDKLCQVVRALIENAIKFSPADSDITVSLTQQNQQLILRVSDKGSGIARENMAKIFDGFYKGSDNHQEGMGVGLLLAKHIIQYHKGSINVHSQVKKGTTVEVKLPQQKL
jgi:K+-sensing histidine kinase KdpD